MKEAVSSYSDVRSGGISSSGEFVDSDYFVQLKKLGDFDSATRFSLYSSSDAYHYPYLDFGISQIYGKLHYVLGMIYHFIKLKFIRSSDMSKSQSKDLKAIARDRTG